MSLIYRIARAGTVIFVKILFRLEAIGAENIPEKGSVIVVSNHSSYIDPFIIGAAIKKRQPTYLAKKELFKIPLVNLFVKQFSLPIDRDKAQPSTIKEIVRRLKNSGMLVMFPEGGRSKDGSLLEVKRGIGMMAALSGAAVVPAYIDGAYEAFPSGAKFIRPRKIKIFFGKPIKIDSEDKSKDSHEKIGNNVMEEIRKIQISIKGKNSEIDCR